MKRVWSPKSKTKQKLGSYYKGAEVGEKQSVKSLGPLSCDPRWDHILFAQVLAWKPNGKVGTRMAVLLPSRPTGSWEDYSHTPAVTPVRAPSPPS